MKKGETLYKISRKYEVSVAQIQAWNDLSNSSIIYPGDRIWVSSPELVAFAERGGDSNPAPYFDPQTDIRESLGGSDETTYHIVKPGETVASIAMQFGYTEAKFREINGMSARQILRIGQRVKLPTATVPVMGLQVIVRCTLRVRAPLSTTTSGIEKRLR